MDYIVDVKFTLIVHVPDSISSPEEYADQVGHDSVLTPDYAKEHTEVDSVVVHACLDSDDV